MKMMRKESLFRSTSVLLCLLFFVSCTNWKEEYFKKLDEATVPIKEKIAFFNAKHSELAEHANSKSYDNVDRVSSNDAFLISKALPDDNVRANNPSYYIILNISDQLDINDRIYYDFDDEWFGESYSYYKYHNLDLYDWTENEVSYNLSRYESNIVKPMETAKYLLVIEDKIFVKPYCPLLGGEFNSGYVLSTVQVFDLNTKELIDTFDVAAENSNNVSIQVDDALLAKDGDYSLVKDLYSCLKNNAKAVAEQRHLKK